MQKRLLEDVHHHVKQAIANEIELDIQQVEEVVGKCRDHTAERVSNIKLKAHVTKAKPFGETDASVNLCVCVLRACMTLCVCVFYYKILSTIMYMYFFYSCIHN